MTCRICGVILIMTVSMYIGMTLASNERKRVAELRGFCRFIECIRDGIASMGLPISDICVRFSDPALEKNGFLTRLKERSDTGVGGGVGRSGVLYEALSDMRAAQNPVLSDEEYTLIEEFFSSIGHTDREGEVRRCDYYLGLLKKRLACAEETASANAKISRALPLSLGGLLVIMLL